MFGFPSQDSDIDIRGVFAYPNSRVLGFEPPKENYNEISGVEPIIDISLKELKPFLIEIGKNNGNFLEQLYSPFVLQTSSEHNTIKELAGKCISKKAYDFYSGFASRIRVQGNQTRNLKNFLYATRVYLTGERLLRTGEIVTDLNVLNQDLNIQLINEMIEAKRRREIQRFEGEFDTLNTTLDALQSDLDRSYAISFLPDRPSETSLKQLEDFLVGTRNDRKRFN